MKDYYNILGISKDATVDQINVAWKKEAKRWHPDFFSDPIERKIAEERMKLINEAHDILTNSIKRAQFDRSGEVNDRPDPSSVAHGKLFEVMEMMLYDPCLDKSTFVIRVEAELRNRIIGMNQRINDIKHHVDNILAVVNLFYKGNKKRHHLFDASTQVVTRFKNDIEFIKYDIEAHQIALKFLNEYK